MDAYQLFVNVRLHFDDETENQAGEIQGFRYGFL
jgi:hypothetical protein